MGDSVVDDRIEPLPRVNALHLFALRPTRLEADALGPERPEVFLKIFVDGEVAINGLGADRPWRRHDVLGVAGGDFSEHGQINPSSGCDVLSRSRTDRKRGGETNEDQGGCHD